MLKRALAFTLLVALPVFGQNWAAKPDDAGNLLKDGQFTQGLDGWSVTHGQVQVEGDGPGVRASLDSDSSMQQTIQTVPGKVYELTCGLTCSAEGGGPTCTLVLVSPVGQTFVMRRVEVTAGEKEHLCKAVFTATDSETSVEFQSGEHDHNGPQLRWVICRAVPGNQLAEEELKRYYSAFAGDLLRHSSRYVVSRLAPDYTYQPVGKDPMNRTDFGAWLTALVANKQNLSVRYTVKNVAGDDKAVTASVELEVAWDADGHRNQTLSTIDDVWTHHEDEWILARSKVTQEKHLVDGQETAP